MPRRNFLPAVLLALGLSLSGCAAERGAGPAGGQGGFVGGDGTWTDVPVDQRQPAPDFAGETLNGASFSLAEHRGKVVVINVWGSWCGPCRKEAPDLVAAAEKTKGKAQFVGLNTRDLDRAPAEAFVRAFAVPYPNVYDPRGELLLLFRNDLPPGGIPSTLIVDADGRVAARIIGIATATTLEQNIDDIAAGR